MRLLLIAAIVGIALAAGVLGNVGREAESANAPAPQNSTPVATPNALTPPNLDRALRLPASHSDSNTETVKVGLNGNLILGKPTLICTADTGLDQSVFTNLKTAIDIWNNALKDSLNFEALSLHTRAGGLRPNDCDDVSNTLDVHVEVVHRLDETTDPAGCPAGTSACYLRVPGYMNSPPRQMFRRTATINADAAEIVSTSTTTEVSTLVHELGHVLGLSDYTTDNIPGNDTCDGLVVKPGSDIADPDPNNQHYALMYNAADRDCRPADQTVITGRDLRDLYEAYHVGAITNVHLSTNATLSSGTLTVPFYWGASGIAQASHNASHVAIFGRDVSTAGVPGTWTPLHDRLIFDNAKDVTAVMGLTVAAAAYDEYKIVGVTRGDNQWQGARAEPRTLATDRTFDRTVSLTVVPEKAKAEITATFVEGDPTFVVGVEAGTKPRVLSASLSPRYCWTGDDLVVSALASGGTDGPITRLKGVGETQYTAGATGPCGSTAGMQSFGVQGEWAAAGETTLTLELDDIWLSVHDRPTALTLTQMDPRPTSCTEGREFSVGWEVAGGVGAKRVWIDGMLDADGVSPASVRCPGPGSFRLTGFVLDAEGNGAEWTEPRIRASADLFGNVQVTRITPNSATLGGWAPIIRGASATELSHYYEVRKDDVTVRREGSVFPVQVQEGSYAFTGLQPSTTYKLGVRLVTNEANTEWLDRTETTLSAPTVSSGAATATLSWSAVEKATGYEVKRGESGEVVSKRRSAHGHTFAGLSPGTSYTLYLRTKFGSERSAWVSVAATTLAGPPMGLQAEAGATRARFSWAALSGAQGYEVKRCLGRACSRRTSLTAVEHIFSGLQPKKTYTLYVRAELSGGRTAWSTLEAKMLAPGSDWPTGLQVSVTADEASVSWESVPRAIRYQAQACAGATCVTEKLSGTSHVFAALQANTAYTFTVRARGHGSWSPPASVEQTTLPLVPTAPSGLAVGGLTSSGLTLSWESSARASSYDVQACRGSTCVEASVTGTSHPFTGLEAGTAYTLGVRARNTGGASDWTSISATTPALPLPPAPSIEAGATAVIVSWSEVAGATGYEVKRGATGTIVAKTARELSHTFTGLRAKSSYTLFVRTVVGTARSAWASAAAQTTAAVPPRGLQVEAGATRASFSWTALPGSPRYHVKSCRGRVCSRQVNLAGVGHTFSGLRPRTAYTFYVRVDYGGLKTDWATVSATTLASGSDRPTGLQVTVTTDAATLSWSTVTGATEYQVAACAGATCLTETVRVTSHTFSGLSPDTSYRFTVRARARGSWSPPASEERVTLKPARPPAPTNLSVNGLTASGATLSWRAAVRATSYDVQACIGSTCASSTEVMITSHPFSSLTPNTQYRFQVRARNAAGASDWASISKTTLRLSDVPPPTNVRVSAQTVSSATLAWDTAAGYRYEVWRAGDTTRRSVTAGAGSYSFTSLSANTSYELYVVAKQGSRESTPASSATALTLPAQPTRLSVDEVTASGLRLNWTAISGLSYEVALDAGAWQDAESAGAHSFTDLNAAQRYTLKVRARNDSGASAASSTTKTTLRLSDVPPPTNVRVTAQAVDSATLSWDTADGYSYEVWREGDTTRRSVTAGAGSYSFTSLSANTSYKLYVVAKQGSRESRPASLATALTLPAQPSGLSVDQVTAGGLRLNWTAVSGLSYEVALDAGAWQDAESAGAHSFTDLNAAQHYTLKVRASNDTGDSAPASTTGTTTAKPTCALSKPGAARSTVVDSETRQVTRTGYRYTEQRDQSQRQTRTVECRNGSWATGAWRNSGAPTWGAWVVTSGPNCAITKQPTPEGRRPVNGSETQWVPDGGLEREERRSFKQDQTRSVTWVGVPTCAWTHGAWVNSGGRYGFGSWSRTGNLRCKSAKPDKPPLGRTQTTTEKRWNLVGTVAYDQSRTESQRQIRTATWVGPGTCGWSESAWRDDGTPTYSAWKNTGVKRTKPATRTWPVKTQITNQFQWDRDNTVVCIEYQETRQRYKRKYYQRTYAWNGSSWAGTTKLLFTDPVWSYTTWTLTGKSRLCPQGSEASPPSARLPAGDYTLEWGTQWLEFTVPAGKSVDLSESSPSAGATTISFSLTDGSAELAITASMFAADGSLATGPTVSDPILAAIKKSLSLAVSPPAGASTTESDVVEADCALVAWPETGAAAVDLDSGLCAVAAGGGAVAVTHASRTLSLTLTAERDWLITRGLTNEDDTAASFWFVDLASGSAIALDPATGDEATRTLPDDAPSEMNVWFDALVKSAAATQRVPGN